MIKISSTISINEDDIKIRFMRASGPGGQHVNKVESAVQIQYDTNLCETMGPAYITRLQKLAGRRMTETGVITISSDLSRSQTRNRNDAMERLIELLKSACIVPKVRKKTKPSKAVVTRRLNSKKKKAETKKLRNKKIE
jgi:ribosome-associated protein